MEIPNRSIYPNCINFTTKKKIVQLTPENYTDQELLLLIQQENDNAFEFLYFKYAEELIGYAAGRLDSLEEARDIIHDLFVHFWNERNNISIKISVRAFLFSAVKYRTIDHIRKNITRQKYRDRLKQLDAALPSAIENLDAKDLRQQLDAAVNKLSPRVQQVFKLSRFENLTTKEIAAELDVTEQTVKNQLSTALAFLRESLGPLAILLFLL